MSPWAKRWPLGLLTYADAELEHKAPGHRPSWPGAIALARGAIVRCAHRVPSRKRCTLGRSLRPQVRLLLGEKYVVHRGEPSTEGMHMAVLDAHFFSQALVKEVAFAAILPDRQNQTGPYPVLYLLHGLSDDYTAWLRWTSVERYVRQAPLIVVMPDGDRSFYCDTADGRAYEKAIVQDLIGFVDTHFRTIARREGRSIAGLSMGGYGAMKLALKYPELFRSVTGFSGAYGVFRDWEKMAPEWQRLIGTKKAARENDCFALSRQLKGKPVPAIRFDCGVEDFLLDQNRAFAEHLRRLGIPHEYEEFPGGHDWGYWDLRIQEALAFHCRLLGIPHCNPA